MDIIFFGAGFWGQQAYKKYKVNNYKNQLRDLWIIKRQENTADCRLFP